MVPVVVALGSNLGDRHVSLSLAVKKCEQLGRSWRSSSIYETSPMYKQDQDSFLNQVMVGEIDCGPFSLLAMLMEIEIEMGRKREVKNGPRVIDLDLVAYGSLILKSEVLTLPHPLAYERRFVLEPLAEIFPNFELFGHGKAIELVNTSRIQSQEVVRLDYADV